MDFLCLKEWSNIFFAFYESSLVIPIYANNTSQGYWESVFIEEVLMRAIEDKVSKFKQG